MSECKKTQPSQTIVHAQLEMTTPGDADEVEANAMADAIVGGGKIRRQISNGTNGSGIAVSVAMENQLAQTQGGGRAMPDGLRNMMENGFGRDFSNVRIHTDSQAVAMSENLSAKAFTLGNDIYFNKGQFSPNTTSGQHLIAHELTHVVQGSGKLGREPNGAVEEKREIKIGDIQSLKDGFLMVPEGDILYECYNNMNSYGSPIFNGSANIADFSKEEAIKRLSELRDLQSQSVDLNRRIQNRYILKDGIKYPNDGISYVKQAEGTFKSRVTDFNKWNDFYNNGLDIQLNKVNKQVKVIEREIKMIKALEKIPKTLVFLGKGVSFVAFIELVVRAFNLKTKEEALKFFIDSGVYAISFAGVPGAITAVGITVLEPILEEFLGNHGNEIINGWLDLFHMPRWIADPKSIMEGFNFY